MSGMKEDCQKSKEILNSKLKVIADRNERFAVINDELEKLRLLMKQELNQLKIRSRIESQANNDTD